jgi:hypothetical protein
MKPNSLIFLSLLLLCSCVEEFKIKSSRDEKQLVVQGRIAKGDDSVFYISYSQPLGSQKSPQLVSGAAVRIVGQNGFQSGLAEVDADKGYYWIETKELPDDTMYALQVEVDGESYQSEYLSLLDTPEIEDVVYTENDEDISIRIQTEGDEGSSRHYMWSYEEDWEFHAPIDVTKASGVLCWYNHQIYQHEFSMDFNPYYYCWGNNVSSQINIYSTETLQQNKVNVELLRIPYGDVRISYIYSLLVKQFSLTDKAYNYYRTLENYFEESSSLFPTMPLELKGNMMCTSNPNLRVQGYVLASNVKTKRIFIYESDFKVHLDYDPMECMVLTPDPDKRWTEIWDNMINEGALAIATNGHWFPENNPYGWQKSVLYSRACVDCRTADGATKKRPDFWPTKHE